MTKLKKLQAGWCIGVKDDDIQVLAQLTNLQELELARTKVTLKAAIESLEELQRCHNLGMLFCSADHLSGTCRWEMQGCSR